MKPGPCLSPDPAFPPDIEGSSGEQQRAAWLLASGRWDVCSYLVRFPGAHAFWDRWLVTAVHLRAEPAGAKPPVVTLPGATHEVLIVALDPEHYRADPRDHDGISHLTPVDCAYQVAGLTDRQAAQIVELMVQTMCGSAWSPDSDFGRLWCQRIEHAAMCLRAGREPRLA